MNEKLIMAAIAVVLQLPINQVETENNVDECDFSHAEFMSAVEEMEIAQAVAENDMKHNL